METVRIKGIERTEIHSKMFQRQMCFYVSVFVPSTIQIYVPSASIPYCPRTLTKHNLTLGNMKKNDILNTSKQCKFISKIFF